MRSSIAAGQARVFIVSAILLAGGVLPGVAQDNSRPGHGPQFLAMASTPGARPSRVDAGQVAILRHRVTVDIVDAPIGRALAEIGRAADVEFAYSPEVVAGIGRVRVYAVSLTLAAVLTEVLLDAKVDVLLTGGKRITLMPRNWLAAPLGGEIVGRVTDAKTGGAITGAEVFLPETKWRTTTDTSGRYRLADIDVGSYTLTIRRLGYAKQSRAVTVSADHADTVDVILEPMATRLNELVSTATGPQRRRDIGNAITTINADSVLQTAPIRNLTDLLENRVPGLTVQHTTGAPGDPSKLRLRGLGSILQSNDPVVIVDGVRVYAAESAARSGNLTNQATRQSVRANPVDVPAPSPLDQIDPNIIEKIEVFKGPSAATLYGPDAANGVIVITTKRGRPGPTRWQASWVQGRTTQPGQWPTGYYRWGHDFYSDAPRFCTLSDVLCVADSLIQFQALNVPDLTILGRGHLTQLSLTASGGTQALTYSLTGSYGNEVGLMTLPRFEVARFRDAFHYDPPEWMQRPHDYKSWSVSSAVTAHLNATMDVTLNASVARSDQQRTSLENQLPTLMGIYVDTLNEQYYQPTPFYILQSTESLLRSYYTKQTASTITFTTGLGAQWRPRGWFQASGQAGLNVVPREDNLYLPAGLVHNGVLDSGNVVRGTGRSLVSTFNVQGTLLRPLGLGFVFQTSLGANLTNTTTNDLIGGATGLQPGTSSITSATNVYASDYGTSTSSYGWYVEPGIKGQRIALSTGLRLDGGSAYGTRLTTNGGLGGLLSLPKLNGSWVVSEEPWFPFTRLFSSLRVRAGYGQAQVQPGPTDRLRLYSGSIEDPTSQLLLASLGNTTLRPERKTEFEGGFDADLLDNRFSIELTAYRQLEVDALRDVAIPPSVDGGGTQVVNIGNIRNTGLELTFDVTPVRSSLVTWHARLNYSRNNNILTKLGTGVAANKAAGLVEGYPLYSRWARPILGFVDQNGDGVLEEEEIQVGDSLQYMGRLEPAYISSFSTDAALFSGAVRVSASFSYAAGQTQINQTARTNWVLVRALVDPSVPLSDQASVLASTKAVNPTDYGLMQEVSAFQFNSLSVSYLAPARLTRLVGAQQLSVAVQGSNLGLHTNYRGKDPNVNAWSPGETVVDTGVLPQPRTWQLRVDLRY